MVGSGVHVVEAVLVPQDDTDWLTEVRLWVEESLELELELDEEEEEDALAIEDPDKPEEDDSSEPCVLRQFRAIDAHMLRSWGIYR
jgi:hypothetical protein